MALIMYLISEEQFALIFHLNLLLQPFSQDHNLFPYTMCEFYLLEVGPKLQYLR